MKKARAHAQINSIFEVELAAAEVEDDVRAKARDLFDSVLEDLHGLVDQIYDEMFNDAAEQAVELVQDAPSAETGDKMDF